MFMQSETTTQTPIEGPHCAREILPEGEGVAMGECLADGSRKTSPETAFVKPRAPNQRFPKAGSYRRKRFRLRRALFSRLVGAKPSGFCKCLTARCGNQDLRKWNSFLSSAAAALQDAQATPLAERTPNEKQKRYMASLLSPTKCIETRSCRRGT